MGLGDFFKSRKIKVGVKYSYGVTQLGKIKDEKAALDGAYGKVLNYLVEDGPSSVSEIERQTGLSNEKVKMVLGGLRGSGYVREIGEAE